MHPAEDAYGRYRARIHLYRHALRLRLSKERSSSSRPTRPERACHDPRRVAGLLSYNELSPHVCIRPAGSMRVPSGGRYIVLLPSPRTREEVDALSGTRRLRKGGYGGSSTDPLIESGTKRDEMIVTVLALSPAIPATAPIIGGCNDHPA